MNNKMAESQALPIIFIPGLLSDAALFAHQTSALQADGHICTVVEPTFDETVQARVAALMPSLPPRFSIVALSMGGYIAFELLRQVPDRVVKVVLMNTNARADTEEHKVRRKALVELSRTGRFKGVTPRLLPNLINQKHLENTAITDVIFDMAERVGQRHFESQQMLIMNRPDSRDVLPTITQPTLVIGGVDDRIVPPDVITEMANAIPGARLEILDDCGHLAPLEQAEAVTGLVMGFL